MWQGITIFKCWNTFFTTEIIFHLLQSIFWIVSKTVYLEIWKLLCIACNHWVIHTNEVTTEWCCLLHSSQSNFIKQHGNYMLLLSKIREFSRVPSKTKTLSIYVARRTVSIPSNLIIWRHWTAKAYIIAKGRHNVSFLFMSTLLCPFHYKCPNVHSLINVSYGSLNISFFCEFQWC